MEFLRDYFVAIWVVLAITVVSWHLIRRSMLLEKDFAWYKAQNPDCVGNGKVKCNQCGGEKIVIRNMYNRMYTRTHTCSTCGTDLYFSKETR